MATETPFMVLPSSMPSRGMAYCGEYHGSLPMIAPSANSVTANDDTNIEIVPTPNPHQPVNRRCWRAVTSRPATVSITRDSKMTGHNCALANSHFNTRPINSS